MSSSTPNHSSFRVQNHHAQNYLARSEGLAINSNTAETYDGILNEYVNWLRDNDIAVLDVTWREVRDYVEACVLRGNREGTLSSKLSVVDEFYRYIHIETDARKHLTLDPLLLTKIDVTEYNTPPKIEREPLDREEIRHLFDAFNSYRNRLMCIVGVETAIRNSDIRGLLLQHVHPDHIHIHDPKGSRPYDVPISDDLHFELDYWRRNVRSGYAYADDSEYVFPSQHGEMLQSNGSLTAIIKQAADRAGLQTKSLGRSYLSEEHVEKMGLTKPYREWSRVTPHTLRHSCITLMKDADVPITYRMLVSNHRDPATNLAYTHGGNDVIQYIRDSFSPPR